MMMTFQSSVKLSAMTLATIAVLCGVGQGQDDASQFDWSKHEPKWHATFNADFKTGNSRHLSRLGFTFPIAQTEDSLLFLDFRGRMADNDDDEFNLGLAYRKILPSNWIFGAYGHFDRIDTAHGNVFEGGTFGFELLNETWDFRVNGYLPEQSGQDAGPAPGFGNIAIVGNQLFLINQRLEERAYQGFDYEVGKLLTRFGENANELRLFGGGYYFDNDAESFPEIAGPRMRLEARMFDVSLLGEGSRVTLSGEWQWDRVRDTEAFAGIGVQIPLSKWGKGRAGGESPFGAGRRYADLSRLERRMYDPIVRDVDVVTNTAVKGEALVPLFFPLGLHDGAVGFQSFNFIPSVGSPLGIVAVNDPVSPTGIVHIFEPQWLNSVVVLPTIAQTVTPIFVPIFLPTGTQSVAQSVALSLE